jgi:hypothetical protein
MLSSVLSYAYYIGFIYHRYFMLHGLMCVTTIWPPCYNNSGIVCIALSGSSIVMLVVCANSLLSCISSDATYYVLIDVMLRYAYCGQRTSSV